MSEGPVDTGAPSRSDWRPRHNPWAIAVTVTSAAFMEILDTTIVNVALPHIAGSLSVGPDEATWALTSYLVANGIVLPVSGWFGSVLGRKRYFMICIAMFTVCSLLCGLATSLPQLILFRVAQGFFGGGLQPNQQSIILDTFPPAKRGAAFSVTAIATIVAPVLGPTLGGIITDNISWRWIFFINVPVGIIAWLAVMALVEDPPWAKAAARNGRLDIDYIGLSLIALGLGSLEIVLDRGEQDDWLGSPFIRTFAVMAILGIVGAVCWLLVAKKPVVNIRVLANRNFALGATMIFSMAVVLYSSAVLIPQLAQQQLGYTATWAGMVLSPGALLTIFTIPVVGRLLPLIQTRHLIAVGFVILGFALFYAASITPQVNFGTLAFMRMFQTFGLAFLFVPISTIAFSTIKPELNRDAASLYTMFRNIAGSVGISVATSLVTEHSQTHMAYMAQHLSPFDQPYLDTLARNTAALEARGVAATSLARTADGLVYKGLLLQSSVQAYLDVFVICAVLAFLIVPLTFLFAPSKAGGRRPAGAD
ncbi:MFS transporter [Aliidongia dinghuensis]|uniref:MFS transporter n=1 Tax=Aliidongia dinghuensis TaxID=1867774 RepID=A0A8J3E1Q9_9PROT|nr:DHA2 family efflux MFS transporter permease subunit [Aliidongia dinghuensis]GGF03249.1 MFS transporter [Aliidongia dinghuensis]